MKNQYLLINIETREAKDVTPEMVAELFAGMGSDEQALFFNHVASIASTWDGMGFPMQLQFITEDDGLSLAGRRVMQEIGEYSHWGLSCTLGRKQP